MPPGDWILIGLMALAAVPWLVLAAEALLSLLPVRSEKSLNADRPTCGILVPAHNEATGIVATVRNLTSQLRPGDVLLVVADNCTDETAALAREAGATVTERHDAERRGKGFALDHGLGQLPPELPVVLVVDADCEMEAGAVDRLAEAAHCLQRPVQGVYLIGTGKESDPKRQLSAFAVLLKNKIRPLGLHRAGLPCLLTGTGMAFPREALRKVNLGSGNIVEDMKLGVDLALAGYAPRLIPAVRLRGAAAPDKGAAIKQRTRWEHGHVATLIYGTPRLLAAGVFRARPGLIGLGLELGVPPLSLLVLVAIGLFTGCVVWWQLGGSWIPGAEIAGSILIAGLSVFAAWIKHGRTTVPLKTLLLLPGYVAWKIPIYLKMLVSRQRKWVRTDRAAEEVQVKA